MDQVETQAIHLNQICLTSSIKKGCHDKHRQFKVLKGYEHWKTVFMEEEFVKMREEAGVKILAKGFDTQNERVYVVQDMDSMEVIQNAMAKNQEKIKEAGVDMSTMQMIPLQD